MLSSFGIVELSLSVLAQDRVPDTQLNHVCPSVSGIGSKTTARIPGSNICPVEFQPGRCIVGRASGSQSSKSQRHLYAGLNQTLIVVGCD